MNVLGVPGPFTKACEKTEDYPEALEEPIDSYSIFKALSEERLAHMSLDILDFVYEYFSQKEKSSRDSLTNDHTNVD